MNLRIGAFARQPARPRREPRSRSGPRAALAILVGGASFGSGAADRLALDARVELRVDRARLEVVLGHLGAAAGAGATDGAERALPVDRTGTTVSGAFHGTVRAALASLVVDHALVLDVRGGTLYARPATDRRVESFDRGDAETVARELATELPAATLPGNLLAATDRTLVIAGHPAFVARAAATAGPWETDDAAARAPAPSTSGRARNDAEPAVAATLPPARPTPRAASAAVAVDETEPPRGAGTNEDEPRGAIRSIDDVPGFY